jgi:hypothetical protein
MGPLFHRILVDQFTRLRDGDRFFYLNQSFDRAERAILDSGNTPAKLIKANTGITNLQNDVFAPALVADHPRQRGRSTGVLDPHFPDHGIDLLKEDLLTDPAPALRPPQ